MNRVTWIKLLPVPALLLILALALLVSVVPASAQTSTPEPTIVPTTCGAASDPCYFVPLVTPTPTADIPEPETVGSSALGAAQDYSVDGVVEIVVQEHTFGCVIEADTQATGQVSLCIRYIEIQGIGFIGQTVPLWPFQGLLVVFIVGFLIRR